MVDVGLSHVLDENNLTQEQEKCLGLDTQAIDIMYRSLDDSIFGEIIDMKTAHEIGSYLNKSMGQSPMMMMSPRRRHMRMLSMTTTW